MATFAMSEALTIILKEMTQPVLLNRFL